MKANETESVRIDSAIVERVKKHVKDSRQTIGGYISMTLDKALNKVEKYKMKLKMK